jgi:hypothetical protein
MNISHRVRQSLLALVLVLTLTFTAACSGVATQKPQANYRNTLDRSVEYGQLARGDSAAGQDFGDWIVETSQGLVKALAQSLAQGFRKNFPNQDLTVLMYAPDKELILTARYDAQTKQIEYQSAS